MKKQFVISVLTVVIAIIALMWPCRSDGADQDSLTFSKAAVRTIRLKYDMSVYELITKSGYTIRDEDVLSFLSEFTALNGDVKSISRLKKGFVVKLPVKHLQEVAPSYAPPVARKSGISRIDRKLASEKRQEPEIITHRVAAPERDTVLKNIIYLSRVLNNDMSVQSDGFKLFSVTERSEISLDSSFFPVFHAADDRIVLYDYTGILPVEIKNIIEVMWPEYRIVSYRGRFSLKPIVGLFLDAVGYAVYQDRRIVAGGKTRIEYDADFIAVRKKADLLSESIIPVGVVENGQRATPDGLLHWFREQKINIIELSNSPEVEKYGGNVQVHSLAGTAGAREFAEGLLSSLGASYVRNRTYDLSSKKAFSYRLRADVSLNVGSRTKIIEYADLTDDELSFAKKNGFDIICVRTWDERRNITRQILDLLSVPYDSAPESTAKYITPRSVKYRLISDGFYVESSRGALFLTDADIDPELLKLLVDDAVSVITF